jgi:hypothetical protein
MKEATFVFSKKSLTVVVLHGKFGSHRELTGAGACGVRSKVKKVAQVGRRNACLRETHGEGLQR